MKFQNWESDWLKSMLKDLLKKWFLVSEIRAKDGMLHFRRWRLLQLSVFAIYIHQIFESDKDAHLHNHPYNFITCILKGAYYEDNHIGPNVLAINGTVIKKHHASYHRITVLSKVTSLFLAFGPRQDWGYCVDGKFVDHVTYRSMKRNGAFEDMQNLQQEI